MAVFNLSAIADRARYLEQERGMSREEATQTAREAFGFDQEFSAEVDAEFQKLLNNQNQGDLSNELGNDRERLIDRRHAGQYQTFDTNPNTDQTVDTQAGAQPEADQPTE